MHIRIESPPEFSESETRKRYLEGAVFALARQDTESHEWLSMGYFLNILRRIKDGKCYLASKDFCSFCD
ncbi:hypothetical protein [Silvibacterium sp.]|uniref:hypothetical protein n=1 Tax=Silvibacterium sp. TaxID=1964179 RepID=UPI0039E42AB1